MLWSVSVEKVGHRGLWVELKGVETAMGRGRSLERFFPICRAGIGALVEILDEWRRANSIPINEMSAIAGEISQQLGKIAERSYMDPSAYVIFLSKGGIGRHLIRALGLSPVWPVLRWFVDFVRRR